MTRYSLLTFTIVLSLLLSSFQMDDAWFDKIVSKFQSYQRNYPQEKVYLHLDRPYYSAGERIWFKAYLVTAMLHEADSISRVLYVDLVNKQNGKIILMKKVAMSSGIGRGELALGDSLAVGEYRLRAYTNWMRNYDDSFFFQRDIKILRPDFKASSLPPNPDDIDVQFMPEGGHLVANLESRVAFKALNTLGKGTDITGAILNQANDTVAGFNTGHLGMGFFNLKPESGQQYRIEVRKPNGQYVKYPMPEVLAEGFVLTVDNLSNKDNIRVIVRHNKNVTQGELALFAHTRGLVVYGAKGAMAKKTLLFNVPRAELPEGVIHFTLFDEQAKPVAERLAFINKNQQLNIQVATDKQVYKSREKVEVEITAKDANGQPVSGNFSLAAVDAGQIIDKELYADNIRSYFLLTSDLKGNIEEPARYFSAQNTNSNAQLDLLMMTQGWRRFNWAAVLSDSVSAHPFYLEQGISFQGKVTRLNKKQVGKVKLTFMMMQKDSAQSFLTGESSETGEFAVYDVDLRDTTNLLVQAVTERGNRNLVLSLTPFQPAKMTVTKVPYNPIEFDANELAEYLRRTEEYLRIERQIRASREQMLQEVVVKAKKADPLKDDGRRALYGNPDATVKFDQINTAGAMSIFDVIQGRVAGVTITGSGMDRTVQIRGAANFSGVVEPLFVLDGMPVDKQAIMNLPPSDVEAVDILKGASAAIYGSRGGGGVIAILTKRGGSNYDWSKEAVPGTLVTKILGYSPEIEFYAPKYDTPAPEHVRPDFRPTVFWVPLIQTNQEGKAKVTFFTSDAKSTIQLKVEGMTSVGKMGVGQGQFKTSE